ncbi:uncharacterized protein LOC143027841 [Oratosquilla oratoria]|uniref:uncharacterized protein LOC143027841 n=1 Tax=Oratosquilla oratoria TaxID=337810 RepID=UPI003F7642B7
MLSSRAAAFTIEALLSHSPWSPTTETLLTAASATNEKEIYPLNCPSDDEGFHKTAEDNDVTCGTSPEEGSCCLNDSERSSESQCAKEKLDLDSNAHAVIDHTSIIESPETSPVCRSPPDVVGRHVTTDSHPHSHLFFNPLTASMFVENHLNAESMTRNSNPSSRETRSNLGTDHGPKITVELLQKELWNKFYQMGTEMIITKNGRRMFPVIKVRVRGLDPCKLYIVYLDMIPKDNRRYRYVYPSSRWVVAGTGEAPSCHVAYIHHDSPQTGAAWNDTSIVSFDRLKLTNNKTRHMKEQISLCSMQKYQPRVWVQEVTRPSSPEDLPNLVDRSLAYLATFPETSFITVTAYQNQQITRLKIDSNPFAKGFRDNSAKPKDTMNPRIGSSEVGVDPCSPGRFLLKYSQPDGRPTSFLPFGGHFGSLPLMSYNVIEPSMLSLLNSHPIFPVLPPHAFSHLNSLFPPPQVEEIPPVLEPMLCPPYPYIPLLVDPSCTAHRREAVTAMDLSVKEES